MMGSMSTLIGIVVALAITGSGKLIVTDTLILSDFIKNNLNISQIINHLFPTNLLIPFIKNNVLQLVFLSMFISYALIMQPQSPVYILKLFSEITEVLLKMLEWLIKFAPYAIFAYSTWLAGSLNVDTLVKFSMLFQILFAGFLMQLVTLGLYIKIYAKLNPFKFFAKSFEYQVFALTTGSSKASLPFTITQSISQLGISPTKANFLIPLGASINMAGLAIYLSSTSIFLANFYNIELSFADYIMIFILALLSPVGAAGIIGGALLIIPIFLSTLGIPLEALVFITALDPLINGIRTAINITGDVGVALVIDKIDKELNEDIYNK